MRPPRAAGCLVGLGLALALGASTPGGAEPAAGRDTVEAGARDRGSPDAPAGLAPLLQLKGESRAPLTIESDEVELQAMEDESRLLRFLRNVSVVQGEFRLRTDLLEAYYPPEEPEPSRLVARGSVEIDQPGQRAFCDEAEYRRETDLLVCRGHARLVQGCDEVRGEAIELALSGSRARVVGAARVVIAPREGPQACVPAAGAEEEERP
jgi:lipopolysaccharide transport protein LptA